MEVLMKFEEKENIIEDNYNDLESRDISGRCLDSEASKAVVEYLRQNGYPVNDTYK
ncbi:MAG: hypothetical protein U9M94_01440 [Patescibacteria group bacterium]|nr:hypothetical protein [Patescibacteria group bacterium]